MTKKRSSEILKNLNTNMQSSLQNHQVETVEAKETADQAKL